jgi:hypothetical protein
LWRELREDEIGRVKITGPPAPLVQDVLLAVAKKRPSLRPIFARVLLTARPREFSSFPDISDRDLVAALRVTHHLQVSGEWKSIHEAILRLLLEKEWYGRPLGSQDVRRCQMVLSEVASYWGKDTVKLRRELDEIRTAWKENSQPRPHNRPGRPTGENTQRMRIAVHFLKTCGEEPAEEMVSNILGELPGRHVAPESIKRTIAKRKSSWGKKQYNEWAETQLNCWLLALASNLTPYVND